jgi:hypothetical protein
VFLVRFRHNSVLDCAFPATSSAAAIHHAIQVRTGTLSYALSTNLIVLKEFVNSFMADGLRGTKRHTGCIFLQPLRLL